MKRRDFIKQSSLASGAFFIPSFMKAMESNPFSKTSAKKLVVIQLSGGNDGLNTVVPYRNDIYYRERPTINISASKVLKATSELGFNSDLPVLKNLYDKGYLSIINNVGYPNPNRSHFRSSDIWHTASASNQYLSTGWLGRYLEHENKMPYQGIEVDDTLSVILKGITTNGIATKNPAMLHNNMSSGFINKILEQQSDSHLSEHNLGYLYKTLIDAKSSSKYIYETSKTYNNTSTYPSNPFADQLKTAATFINSGLDTQVYYISMGGFDTHVRQEQRQKQLHATFSDSLSAFIEDLEKNDTFKDTLVMVFSEFGRRVQENASKGTDHGTANQVFIVGKDLKKPGFYNDAPNLLQLDANGDIKYSVDFREVYATLLDKWLRVESQQILNTNFATLGFI